MNVMWINSTRIYCYLERFGTSLVHSISFEYKIIFILPRGFVCVYKKWFLSECFGYNLTRIQDNLTHVVRNNGVFQVGFWFDLPVKKKKWFIIFTNSAHKFIRLENIFVHVKHCWLLADNYDYWMSKYK